MAPLQVLIASVIYYLHHHVKIFWLFQKIQNFTTYWRNMLSPGGRSKLDSEFIRHPAVCCSVKSLWLDLTSNELNTRNHLQDNDIGFRVLSSAVTNVKPIGPSPCNHQDNHAHLFVYVPSFEWIRHLTTAVIAGWGEKSPSQCFKFTTRHLWLCLVTKGVIDFEDDPYPSYTRHSCKHSWCLRADINKGHHFW